MLLLPCNTVQCSIIILVEMKYYILYFGFVYCYVFVLEYISTQFFSIDQN